MPANPITVDDLGRLEAEVAAALRRKDSSNLTVIGFGEISVGLGYPAEDPTHVCKRMPPLTPTQFDRYRDLVDRYVTELREAGLSVVDTEVMAVPRDDKLIAYLVQPLLPAESLGHRVLAEAQPDADHPFLVALADTLALVSSSRSIDAQVTNWSWDGGRPTLLDVGTPFLWDRTGELQFDMTPYLPMIPAPLRRTVKRDLTTVVERWRRPRGVAVDVVANLYREGLEQWVPPTVTALNTILGATEAISADEGRAIYSEDLKTFPRLARLKRVERTWRTVVRRSQYDFFIQSTYATSPSGPTG